MSSRTIIQHARGYAVILGELTQNDPHRHYSLHLAMGLKRALPVMVEADQREVGGALVLDSWIEHRIGRPESGGALIVSLGPISNIGQLLRSWLRSRRSGQLTGDSVDRVRATAQSFLSGGVSAAELCRALEASLAALSPGPVMPEPYDPRILKALGMIAGYADGFLPATRVAGGVGLSEGRFLHLFREQTGMSYRRMQLWMRLARAFSAVGSGRPLTEVAYEYGFADSAHFSRAFHQAFGMAPSVLVQDSRFVQVGPED